MEIKFSEGACVEKAMDNINKRIHTEITRRIKGGIKVTFQATVGEECGPDKAS